MGQLLLTMKTIKKRKDKFRNFTILDQGMVRGQVASRSLTLAVITMLEERKIRQT